MRKDKRTCPGLYVTYLRRTPLEMASGDNEYDEQRTMIHRYLQNATAVGGELKIVKEFIEKEGAYGKDFPELVGPLGAIIHTWLTGSSLVVASMDRLPHSVNFVALVLEKLDILSCDLPFGSDSANHNLNLHMAVIYLEDKAPEEDGRLLASRIRDLLQL